MWYSLIILISLVSVSSADEQCEECRFAVELLHDAWGDKITTVCSYDVAMFICINFHIEDHFVCKGILGDFTEEFMYVFNQIVLEPHEICGIFFKDCGDVINPLIVKWLLPMPENKPAFVPKIGVQPNQPKMTVLHLTDLHLDMDYTPGTETDCTEPLCCRPPNDLDELSKSDTIKVPAGYWGMVGDCDVPYYLLTNMLNQISKVHTDLDYIVITGDLMSHADWNYNNVSHAAIIKNVSDTFRTYFPNIPIYNTVGNHEGVPIDNFAPHYTPSKYHMDWLYGAMADAWKGYYPDDQTASVKYNGCFMKKLFPGLRLISLSNVLGDSNNFWLYINQTDPDGTMTWLIDQLYAAEADGDKVHIMAHITGGNGESLEGWSINYYNVVNRFANTIAAQFFGHVHAEGFFVTYMNPEDPTSRPTSIIYGAPSFTTYSSYYPAYRIYTIDGNYPGSTFQVIDWEEWVFNITENNANPKNPTWTILYPSVNAQYGLTTQTPDDWDNLIKRMITDKDTFKRFRQNHYRRNEYDGIGPCDDNCRYGYLCDAQQFHHSDALCSNLPGRSVSPKKAEYRKRKTHFHISKEALAESARKWKVRDSENCPL